MAWVAVISMLLLLIKINDLLLINFLYLFLVGIEGVIKNKSLKIGLLSIYTTIIQFYGYGIGFLKSFYLIHLLKKDPKKALPEMFFK